MVKDKPKKPTKPAKPKPKEGEPETQGDPPPTGPKPGP